MQQYKVIIIGAGPSGIAAAIQLKRYGIEPLIIEKNEVGGLLRNANLVENYPGFPEGVRGKELVSLFKNQLDNTGISVIKETVLKVDYRDKFVIITDKNTYDSEYIIIASGTIPKLLPLLNKIPAIEDKVFYEICEIEEVKNKKIVIIGAGDAAFDYAINLSRHNKITILNRGSKLKCLPVLYEKSKSIKAIKYLDNINLIDIAMVDNKLVLKVDDLDNAEIEADYLLAAVGREPDLTFLEDDFMQLLEELEDKKLFTIGDVKNGNYRQIAISAGDGIKAAMMISERSDG